MNTREPFIIPLEKSMQTDPTEAASPTKLALLVMAGLPKPAIETTNTGQISTEIKEEIFKFSWRMKTENYAEETITRYTRALTTLSTRGANLYQAESIKEVISVQKWDNGTKQSTRNAALLFFIYHGITATIPAYEYTEKIVFIPTENEIDQLISGCKHRLATFLQTLKETAARFGEALQLKWTDLNTENMTLSITPEKGSNPRAPKISTKLLLMLNALPKTTAALFGTLDKETARKNFQRARARIAKNTGNPRLNQIHFHTLRHWRATQELRDTNNVWCVMELLGHKSLSNTQKYIHLLGGLSNKFVSAIAHNAEEAMTLINDGYTYADKFGEDHIYRKLK